MIDDFGVMAMRVLRSMWTPFGRLANWFRPKKQLAGFRLARTGKHKSSCLTRHEQTRNPSGSKLWKACPLKTPCWETGL